ncbi:MAG TPA: hypothetical protein VFP31_01310 [Gaiellaceae bacterium]|nr:hypothetical protein [Gaiellaceae bacterium]
MDYEALRQLTRDRREGLTRDAHAERLWLQARRRQTRRRRLLLDAARDWLLPARRAASRA